jgi:thioredoxin family protein
LAEPDERREGEIRELLAEVPQSGTSLGSKDAPATIYLYEDLQRPACAAFTRAAFARETFPQLVGRYVELGEVKVVSETLAILVADSAPPPEPPLRSGSKTVTGSTLRCSFSNQGRENSGYPTEEFLTGIAE